MPLVLNFKIYMFLTLTFLTFLFVHVYDFMLLVLSTHLTMVCDMNLFCNFFLRILNKKK